jgi:beta-glucosidase
MKELGLGAFRFSIGWPRIQPEGRGRPNPAGLDFYDRLVDELLANGISPFVTLNHWDLPQRLEDEGGWPERSTAEAFVEYAEAVVDRLGDRVKHWITHNEPWVVAWLGYGVGEHAPGRTSRRDAIATAHHLLLSHGLAVEAIRSAAPDAEVGITLNLGHITPATSSPEDVAAAREADGELNRWFLDPIFLGSYPADMLERFGPDGPPVQDGDAAVIAAPIDFLGVNYYRREVVRRGPDGGRQVVHHPDSVYTDMGWEVSPEGLHRLLVRLRDDYAPPALYVTENGAAFGDVRGHDGSVHDPERQAYVAGHLAAAARAVSDLVPLRGYFAWSLLDNFEWAHGYQKRFGLIYVDYPTLERIPKSSFYWYRDFIARNSPGPAPEGSATNGAVRRAPRPKTPVS